MVVMIESLIGILLFTILIVSLTLKIPLPQWEIIPGHKGEMYGIGLNRKKRTTFPRSDIIQKGIALLAFVFIFAVILKQFNGADTFWKGVRDSYMIWLIIDWYDALVLDCIWFCHSKKVRIPGTEDMEEYKDYRFHIRQSCIGMLLGLPACLAVGVITAIL